MDTILTSGTGGEAPAGDLIKDTTTQTFMADVIEASRTVPVLVDFWAPWCGPCKQLGPILERAVAAARGAVKLVKMNIDENPEIPGQMGVRSIPAVFAFKDGRPVDGFMGALPESQVKAFIERIAGPGAAAGPAEDLAAADAALAEGAVNEAAQIYAAILQADPQNAEAIAGLAKCYIRTGELDRAEQTLSLAPPASQTAAPIASAKAELELARKAGSAGDVDALKAKVAGNPADFQARLDLAIALNASGDRMGAMEELMAIITRNRAWSDDAARKQLVQFFEAWGSKDPATITGRQKLSSVLFA
jgi:putative thioredoxin